MTVGGLSITQLPRAGVRRLDLAVRGRVTLADLFEQLAVIWGDRPLVHDTGTGRSLTYRQAAELVAAWSNDIGARIDAGDVVVVATQNGYDQLLLCAAVSRAGGIPAPVNPQMRDAEIGHVESDSGASLTIRTTAELSLDAPEIAATTPARDDVGALFYTSGTTGTPKGAALTHAALVGQSTVAALWPARLRRDEVVLALPVAHIMGFAALVGFATAGLPVYLLERFSAPAVLDAIEQRRATIFIGVPAMYRSLDEAGADSRDLSSIRVWISGADVMPSELVRRFKSYGASAHLPGVGPVGEAAFAEGYGMVEVGGGVAAKFSPPFLDTGVGPSLGFRLPGHRFRVVNPSGGQVPIGGLGELHIKGPGVLREYWRAPEATDGALTDDGWLRTGDLVRLGPFGSMLFEGRLKQVVKSGGFSVYPVEVEAVLESHPDVVEASVVGLDDDQLGEVPVAAVRLRRNATVSGAELVAWAREQLSHYKRPRQIMIVDELPRTGTEKVDKSGVKAFFD